MLHSDRVGQQRHDTIGAQTEHSSDDAESRRELTAQLERLRELYVMGDLTKSRYVMRRQMLEEELQRTKPPTDPDLDRAQALLGDSARFWDAEPEPAERRKLLLSLFAQVWAKDGEIVAVKPNAAFARYFTAASEARAKRPKAGAGDEATKAGATGLEPATSAVTGQRSNQLSYAPARACGPRGQYAWAEYRSAATCTGSPRRQRRPAHRSRPSWPASQLAWGARNLSAWPPQR